MTLKSLLEELLIVYQDRAEYLEEVTKRYDADVLLESIFDAGRVFFDRRAKGIDLDMDMVDEFTEFWVYEDVRGVLLDDLFQSLNCGSMHAVAEWFKEESLVTLFALSHPTLRLLPQTGLVIDAMRSVETPDIQELLNNFHSEERQVYLDRLAQESPLFTRQEVNQLSACFAKMTKASRGQPRPSLN